VVIGVLLRDEQIVGFASVGSCKDEVGAEGSGKIFSLYLHPLAWGAGVSKLLLNWCEQTLVARSCTSCRLWVVDINARARRFYEKHGFVLDGVFKVENGVVLCRMQKERLVQAA
jgi:GNAT superfamily N-acetyltransferase